MDFKFLSFSTESLIHANVKGVDEERRITIVKYVKKNTKENFDDVFSKMLGKSIFALDANTYPITSNMNPSKDKYNGERDGGLRLDCEGKTGAKKSNNSKVYDFIIFQVQINDGPESQKVKDNKDFNKKTSIASILILKPGNSDNQYDIRNKLIKDALDDSWKRGVQNIIVPGNEGEDEIANLWPNQNLIKKQQPQATSSSGVKNTGKKRK